MRCDQWQRLRPQDHHVDFIKKSTLACALGDLFETGGSKAHLFHDATVSDQAITMTHPRREFEFEFEFEFEDY